MDRSRLPLAGLAIPMVLLAAAGTASAAPAFSCGGFAQLGGAQIICSHVDPKSPPLICSFSWALLTPTNGAEVAQGSFLLPRGVVNDTVYTGSGFTAELSSPIIMCQAKRSGM